VTAPPAAQEGPALALWRDFWPRPGLGGVGAWDRGSWAHGGGVRAERRIGELIQAQRETVGLSRGRAGKGRPKKGGSDSDPPKDDRPTLAEAGIDKRLADRARKYAAIPERVAIAAALEAEIGSRQGERTDRLGDKRPQVAREESRTATLAAKAAGFRNRKSYERARVILTHGSPALVAGRLATLKQGRPGKGENDANWRLSEAAERLNVSPRSVNRARVILTHGSPELVAAVDREAIRAPGFRSRGRGPGARSGVRRRCESSRIA